MFWLALLFAMQSNVVNPGTAPPTSPPPVKAVPVSKPHLFVSEGTYAMKYPYNFDLTKCGTSPDPAKWSSTFKANLKAAYTAEKANYQSQDKFAELHYAGFNPEAFDWACINWAVTLGHYLDEPRAASAFVVTARHILGGPMYCITNEYHLGGGGTPVGEAAISTTGGPIPTPDGCAALPPLSVQVNRIPH